MGYSFRKIKGKYSWISVFTENLLNHVNDSVQYNFYLTAPTQVLY